VEEKVALADVMVILPNVLVAAHNVEM